MNEEILYTVCDVKNKQIVKKELPIVLIFLFYTMKCLHLLIYNYVLKDFYYNTRISGSE